ncbi:larval cuticle protein A2B-like [Anastrepha obliqua]|uniref:larval cuticle protein A2B-like n=1 Tax=Anastrepha obliqua TaxID=95512 RepID=UPI00240A7A9E|nr:larval cuticle protein A2B-like [Anastrepha obliqua]
MAFKFAAAFTLLAVASAGLLPAAQVYHTAPAAHIVKAAPVAYAAQPVLTKAVEEYDPHPQYKYSYDVQDAVSGDSKNQIEERDGDVVRGEYSLIDADGFKRTVQYTADPVNGFNAVVSREPLVKSIAVAPVVKAVAPVAYASPAFIKPVAPVAHAYAAPSYTTYTTAQH